MKITLKAARVNAGILQSDMADSLGVHVATIKNWEALRTKPDDKMKLAIVNLFDIKLSNINWEE